MYLNNPEYVKVNSKEYKINTSYKIGLRCQEIAIDTTISDVERALAIIFLLFGEEAIQNLEESDKFLDLAKKYLSCNQEVEETQNKEQDMDLLQDYRLIQASFKSDYGIDLESSDMHWWDFQMYLNGLTDKCVLNRIREIRTFDTSEIKDAKEMKKIMELKEHWALKKQDKPLNDKQQKGVDNFYKITGIKRKE